MFPSINHCRFTALVEHDVVKATHDIGRVLADLDLASITEEEVAAFRRTTPPAQFGLTTASSYGLFSRRFLRRHGRDLFRVRIGVVPSRHPLLQHHAVPVPDLPPVVPAG